MAKQSKLKEKIFYTVSILLALVAIFMIFVDVSAVTKNGESGYVLTGVQATFGYSETVTGLGLSHTTIISTFSFMNLFVYICLIAGVVLSVLKMMKVLKANIIDWVIFLLFILSTVLYLRIPSFVIYGNDVAKLVSAAVENGAAKSLLAGSIIGAISSLCAAITIAVKKIFVKK